MLPNIPTVYEDNYLLVVNKPPGLLTVAGTSESCRNLTQILNEDVDKRKTGYKLYPCHRLDKETSGLVMYAKSKDIEDKIKELFKARQVHKAYCALVQGQIKQSRGTIHTPIQGQQALTAYRLLERRPDFSVVEVTPQTGRTNQIRLHFRSIGHPLVGETRFAFRRDFKLRAKRVLLHAMALEFQHPITNKTLHVEIELPRDIQKFLAEH